MARAYPHWVWLQAQTSVLAVFSGPNTYISPTHCNTRPAMPTCNNPSVHVYGALSLISGRAHEDALLKRLIAPHEPAYADQWRGLMLDFQDKFLGAIVNFSHHRPAL